MEDDWKLASIGVELSQGQAAICLAVPEWRDDGLHFVARLLERLPHRIRYADVARRLDTIVRNLLAKGRFSVCSYVNASEVGLPAVELIRSHLRSSGVVPIEFNHGGRRPLEREDVTVLGKAWLVSQLQALLQETRLHLPNNGPNTITLVQELMDYSHRPAPNADELCGAFKVGTQDDLVNAIGLAVHHTPSRPWTAADWDALEAALPVCPAS